MNTIIENAKLVRPWEIMEGVTIGIDGEKVSSIHKKGYPLKADKVIDARGNDVLPGLIDCNTHFGAELHCRKDFILCGNHPLIGQGGHAFLGRMHDGKTSRRDRRVPRVRLNGILVLYGLQRKRDGKGGDIPDRSFLSFSWNE